ncbi:MAG: hypothetical protein HW416_2454 [Chloroflexi bacterium]|nr:hypothetical protein [Chloroflexota bacterium]
MAIARKARCTIGTEVWIATALLHREHPERADFDVAEIMERIKQEIIVGEMRAGVETHIRQMCVANRKRDPSRLRILFATDTRRRRLFREGDAYDPGREGGKIAPSRDDVPEPYHYLLEWYGSAYARAAGDTQRKDPILALRGLGREMWVGEDPDGYVRRLREGWE